MPYNAQDRLDTQGPRMAEVNNDPAGLVTIRDLTTGHSVELTATLGRTDSQEFVPGVAVTQVRYQDFLITAADLDFGAGEVQPQVGWEITRANGEVYRVVSLGEKPYEYVTATRKRMRIHTDYIRKP